jgi:hypothetical protein
MLVEATCNGLASCGYEDLYYSALYTDLSCQTTYDGSVAGHVQMTAYAEKCPNSKIILAGYSQGGQIAGDILGGGGGVSFNGCVQPDTPALDPDSSPGNKSEWYRDPAVSANLTVSQLLPLLSSAILATLRISPTIGEVAPTSTAISHATQLKWRTFNHTLTACATGALTPTRSVPRSNRLNTMLPITSTTST